MFQELQALFRQLGNPKFLHVLLEPLPLWGCLIGAIAWMLSLWYLQDRRAQVCSLILLAVSAFSVWPLLHYRGKAAPIASSSAARLKAQTELRRETQWVFYGMGAAAVAGLFLTGDGKGKLGGTLNIVIAAGGVSTAVFSLWLHEKEVALFHPDTKSAPSFRRSSSPTPVPVKKAVPVPGKI